MPDDDVVPLELSLRVATATGDGLTVAYDWTHPADGPQQGFLFLFDGEEPQQVEGMWLDTWHQTPRPMRLTGTADDSGVRLSAPYAQEWEWSIRLRPGPGLLFAMDNQGPDVPAYAAMSADCSRVQ
jgi:hypothetical protein